MFNLVYKSVASPVFEQSQIKEMLENARDFNQRNNITGCLLFFNGEFIQYLEGNQIVILSLYDRIMEDIRHRDVELLSHGEIEAREFETWDMAYENLHGENNYLQFIRLLVSSYLDGPTNAVEPNPTSTKFWSTVRELVKTKTIQ